MLDWLIVYLAAVGLNVVPAFMPPTWMLLTFFHLQRDLPIPALAIVGGLGAVTGRFLLAMIARFFGMRFIPKQYTANIESLINTVKEHEKLSIASLGLFAVGPIPTNQLFIALGLARAPLALPLIVFGVVRTISYLIWMYAGSTTVESLSDAFSLQTTGTIGIIIQIVLFAVLILAMKVDWGAKLRAFLEARGWDSKPAASELPEAAGDDPGLTQPANQLD